MWTCNVSIPFIAGQWSLRAPTGSNNAAPTCFNPLHCGAVVASAAILDGSPDATRAFQSPSLRGSGRFQ